jgi:hypothetical protein
MRTILIVAATSDFLLSAWEKGDVAKLPGVLMADSQDHVIATIRR